MPSMLKTLALAAVASTAIAAPLEPRVNCVSGLYMIVARGSNEAPGEGKPGAVADMVAARVPNSASVAVDYPASIIGSGGLYPESVSKGITDTKNKIQDYVAACGSGSRIVLIGYSQGGNVMSDLLAGGVDKPATLDTKYHNNIKSVVVFGDPTFVANQSYDYGSNANGNNGIFTRANNADGMAKLAAYSSVIASYCDKGDPFCASGFDESVHSNEVANHAQAATDFIVAHA